MTWSVDVVADDWTHINAAEIARRAVSRLEARGKGVLLLHDIHEKTAVALPVILQELKARGFKIVHVVPRRPDRPKTATTPEQWAAHAAPARGLWPRVVVTDMATSAPALTVPSPASFGVADPPGRRSRCPWLPGFDHRPLRPGEVPPPPVAPWPRPNYSAPASGGSFAVPAAQNFQYAHVFAGPRRDTTGARRANGWRLRRRMGSGRRLPIGRPARHVPVRGISHRVAAAAVRSPVVGRAHAAIARDRHGHGGKAKSERGPLTASACQRPKSKGGTPASLPQRAPARSRDLAVFFSILRRYVRRSGGCISRPSFPRSDG
jgi:hypothetical protein